MEIVGIGLEVEAVRLAPPPPIEELLLGHFHKIVES